MFLMVMWSASEGKTCRALLLLLSTSSQKRFFSSRKKSLEAHHGVCGFSGSHHHRGYSQIWRRAKGLLRLILVSVGLAALIMILVAVNIWTRAKGENIHRLNLNKQTQMDEIN
ncbi:hypothetical protein F7725_020016, partial [Dissostichus mawsoni]